MRTHHHDLRDLGQAFALGFEIRRVMLMAAAASWTVAVVGLYFVLIALRVSDYNFMAAFDARHVLEAERILTATRPTPDRILLWAGMLGVWWLGFSRIITPVHRSIAMELSRDERPGSQQLKSATARLSGLVAGGPVTALGIAALFFACVVVWALLAKIPSAAGAVIATLGLPLALIAALIGAIVLIVATVSLPLMAPAAVMECRDLMDVVSRAASYVLQRPLKYLAGLAMKTLVVAASALLGAAVLLLAWLLVYGALWVVGEGELALSAYHLARRSGHVAPEHHAAAIGFSAVFYLSALITLGWLMTVSAATDVILYAVMRYDVDGVTFDEIMIPQEHIAQHNLTAEDTRKQQQAAQEAVQEARAEPAKV